MQIVSQYTSTSTSTQERAYHGPRWKLWCLVAVTLLLFCQAYFTLGGFTIRSEDVLISVFMCVFIITTIARLKLPNPREPLAIPILIWITVLLVGVVVTLSQPLNPETKKNAILNGYRMILMSSLFFVAYYATNSAQLTLRIVLKSVVLFSLLTTLVSLLQIGHWDGWLPFRLPALLTQFGERMSSADGREIFALFVSNNNAHGWSAMLTMQILVTLFIGQNIRNRLNRTLFFVYTGLLFLILLRLSVRNSILGLVIALTGYGILKARYNKYVFNRIFRVCLVIFAFVSVATLVMYILPENYAVYRIRQAIPQFEDGQIVLARGSNISGRFRYWQIAWEIFLQHPMLGGGFYSYAERSEFWLGSPIVHAHNSYLHILAELGTVGIIVLGWLGWRLTRLLHFLWQVSGGDRYFTVGRNLLTCALLFLVFTALFGNPFFSTNQIGFTAIVVGCLASYRRDSIRSGLNRFTNGYTPPLDKRGL